METEDIEVGVDISEAIVAVLWEIRHSENFKPEPADGKGKNIPAYLVMIERCLRTAQESWVGDTDERALCAVRGIAALALKCMRDFGTFYGGKDA